jgi:thioredoxin-like negative regulator of GroEL
MHSKVFLQSVWNQVANKLQKEANVAKVDCTDQAMLCQRQNVNTTPTVILYILFLLFKILVIII